MAVVGTFTVGTLYPQWIPALVVLTLVLCFSRIYLGVHYLGDVLGGLAYGLLFGAVWVLLVSAPV
jgi:membrane-associated phospholipid phosphatase